MNSMKSLARKLLTGEQRWALWQWAHQFLIDAITLPARVAPPATRIFALSNLELVMKVDYGRHDIYLICQSHLDIDRLKDCSKEPETVEWIQSNIHSGDVMWDIGANVGVFSLVASRVAHGTASIYAFEPSFATFAQLCRNVALNRCQDNIAPFQIALSSRTDIKYLQYSSTQSGASGHQWLSHPATRMGPTELKHSQPVLSYSIDDLTKHFPISLPSHIKLDVDGGEYDVLLGAEKTLVDPRLKSILLEFDEHSPDSVKALQLLESKGFRADARRGHGAGLWNCILHRDMASLSK